MIKEAIEYILKIGTADILETNGRSYSTQPLQLLDKEARVDPIRIQSLTGIIEYIQSGFDHDEKVMIHVEDPSHVNLYTALNRDKDRQFYLASTANLPRIHFDRFMKTEEFVIMLQSNFIATPNRDQLLKLIGSIVEDDSVETKDDGIAQTAVVKNGVATRGEAKIPNPVTLQPFRTFVEVRQPASDFILRIRKGPEAALFEADGAAWQLNAMHSIKEYLQEQLKDEIAAGQVVIMA